MSQELKVKSLHKTIQPEECASIKPQKPRFSKKSDIILISIIVAIIGYTVVAIIYQFLNGDGYEISPTLTTAWFSFWSVEIVGLTGIKVSNIIKGTDSIPPISGDECADPTDLEDNK